MQGPGPLRLSPLFLPKIWAAPSLPAALADGLKAPAGTGEAWLATTAISSQPWRGGAQGPGLDRIMAPTALPGREADRFPLLLKVLSVGQWLSVQVHPDDATARRLENEPWGKSEAWHVLAATPEAKIVMGLKPGTDRADLERAMEQGRLTEVLAFVPAHPGDTFHLPAGTIHATGPGLAIFEAQQASDVTYRLYDWDRPGDDGHPRPLHQAKALAALQVSGPGRPLPPSLLSSEPNRLSLLVKNPYFGILQCRLHATYQPWWAGRRLRMLFILEGSGNLSAPSDERLACDLLPGQVWLLPAGLPPLVIEPAGGRLTLLETVDLLAAE